MLGWSRYSMSLSHRLWLAFIITFFCVILFQPAWLTYLVHPLKYPYELLQVLGNILFVELCLGLTLSILFDVFEAIGYKIDNRKRNELFIALEYREHIQGSFQPFMSVLLFLAAVIIAPELKLTWWTAPMGILVYMVVEVLDAAEKNTSVEPQQYATIGLREDWELVNITVQTNKEVISGTLQTNWTGTIAYLMNNEWELIGSSQTDIRKGRKMLWQRTALFRRPYGTQPFFYYDLDGKVEKFLPKKYSVF